MSISLSKLKKFDKEQDYAQVAQWWEAQDFAPIAPECLPETGYIVNDCVAGFMYKTDSKFAWIEWIVSDPESNPLVRRASVPILVDTLVEAAREEGFTRIISSIEHPSLKKVYTEAGAIEADQNMTNYIWRLD